MGPTLVQCKNYRMTGVKLQGSLHADADVAFSSTFVSGLRSEHSSPSWSTQTGLNRNSVERQTRNAALLLFLQQLFIWLWKCLRDWALHIVEWLYNCYSEIDVFFSALCSSWPCMHSLETWLRLLCTCQYLTISHDGGKMKNTWSWSMMECVCPSHWSISRSLPRFGGLANWWCCEVQDGRARHPLSVLMLTRSMVLLMQWQQGCQASYSLTFCILLLCSIDSQVKPWCRHFNNNQESVEKIICEHRILLHLSPSYFCRVMTPSSLPHLIWLCWGMDVVHFHNGHFYYCTHSRCAQLLASDIIWPHICCYISLSSWWQAYTDLNSSNRAR